MVEAVSATCVYFDEQIFNVGISVGVASYTRGMSVEGLVEEADRQMFKNKRRVTRRAPRTPMHNSRRAVARLVHFEMPAV